MSVEEELWNIFTYYTLHGNQKDPSRLNRSGLFKICRDVMVLDPTMTEKPITHADIDLIFTSELKSPPKRKIHARQTEKADRLDYDEFLSCLIRVSEKCYPSSKSSELSFQQLLMDNVLPLASRRKPFEIKAFLENPVVLELFHYYQDALFELYRYFATASDHNSKVRNMMRSTTSHAKSFDEQKELIMEAREVSKQQHATSNLMCYSDYFRFAAEFGMSSMSLTTLDLGDIYLSVIQARNFETDLRKIDFNEFWEALVRCALLAFADVHIPTDEKIKGMFLYIWRFIQSNVQEEISGIGTLSKGGFNTYKGGLLRGSQILNERFIAMWTKDSYRDYLDESKSPSKAKQGSQSSSQLQGFQGSLMERTFALSTEDWTERLQGSSGPPVPDDSLAMSGSRTRTRSSSSAGVLTGLSSSAKVGAASVQTNTAAELAASSTETKKSVHVDIDDNDNLGDDRIKPSILRNLLAARPDLATLLFECICDEGLAEVSDDDSESENEDLQ